MIIIINILSCAIVCFENGRNGTFGLVTFFLVMTGEWSDMLALESMFSIIIFTHGLVTVDMFHIHVLFSLLM